jgi:hypothetical protein
MICLIMMLSVPVFPAEGVPFIDPSQLNLTSTISNFENTNTGDWGHLNFSDNFF